MRTFRNVLLVMKPMSRVTSNWRLVHAGGSAWIGVGCLLAATWFAFAFDVFRFVGFFGLGVLSFIYCLYLLPKALWIEECRKISHTVSSKPERRSQ